MIIDSSAAVHFFQNVHGIPPAIVEIKYLLIILYFSAIVHRFGEKKFDFHEIFMIFFSLPVLDFLFALWYTVGKEQEELACEQ